MAARNLWVWPPAVRSSRWVSAPRSEGEHSTCGCRGTDNLDTTRQVEDRRPQGRRKNRSRGHSWARNKWSATTGRSHIRSHSHMDTRIRIRANPNNTASPSRSPNPSPILPNPNRVHGSSGRRGSRYRESRGRTIHRETLTLRGSPFLRGTSCHETRCRLGSRSRRETRRHRGRRSRHEILHRRGNRLHHGSRLHRHGIHRLHGRHRAERAPARAHQEPRAQELR